MYFGVVAELATTPLSVHLLCLGTIFVVDNIHFVTGNHITFLVSMNTEYLFFIIFAAVLLSCVVQLGDVNAVVHQHLDSLINLTKKK
jgi:hypothetical protein